MLWTAGCGWGQADREMVPIQGQTVAQKLPRLLRPGTKGNEVRIPLGPIATAELSWVELCPQERYVNILTLNLMHVTLF